MIRTYSLSLVLAAFALSTAPASTAEAQSASSFTLDERLNRLENNTYFDRPEPTPEALADQRLIQEQSQRFADQQNSLLAQSFGGNRRYGRQADIYNGRPADADAGSIVTGNIESDLYQQVISMQEEIRSLRGQIEENQFEIRGLKKNMKLLQDDIDFRLKALEPSPAGIAPNAASGNVDNVPPQDGAFRSPTPAPQGNHISVTTAGSGTLAKPGVRHGDAPRGDYNEAFRLLNQNRYDEAASAFEQFTQQYPNDPLIGNAYYWLGETYYIRKDYVTASDNFRLGYQKLPNGPKAPDNLLKLAISLKEQDRNADACVILDQIDKKFQNASSNLLQRAKAEQKLLAC